MKHLLLITIIGLVQVVYTHAQLCNEMEIILGDQAAVDQYNTNYPDCHEQISRLIIEGDDITNLQGLSAITSCDYLSIRNTPNLKSLEGLNGLQFVVNLRLENTDITNLIGLENLDTVLFLMNMYGNDRLKDLTGLGGLKDVFGLFITECDSFQSFSGLHSLRHMEALALDYNQALVNLAGFPNIDTIRQIYIAYNENLTDLTGLESLTHLDFELQILHNPKLTSLQGLNFLEEVGIIEIVNNPGLLNFSGLDAVKSVRNKIVIQENSGLISLTGMNNIPSIPQDFEIRGNIALQSLDGLNALTTIGGHFQLEGNPQLSDITDLSSLDSIGGQLLISNTDQLASLSGLDQLTSLGDLEITFNDVLEACSVESICNYLMSGGHAVVEGNKIGCANIEQILESCLVGSTDWSAADFSIFPNPAQSIVFLPEEISDAVVFDATGRKYPMEIIDGKMDVSAYPSGFYIFRCKENGVGRMATFVKM